MRRTAVFVALALIAAACSTGGDDGSAEPTAAATSTPATTAGAPATTAAQATSAPAPTVAGFAIESVAFGDGAMVIITNIGTEQADLAGHWLCQRPSYAQIPDVTLGPGEQVAIPLGDGAFDPPSDATTVEPVVGLGSLDADSGELALYSAAEFGDSTAIVSYVEWGNSGHGRSGVAVAAGIWPEGGFVATTDSTIGIVADNVPAPTPDAWFEAG